MEEFAPIEIKRTFEEVSEKIKEMIFNGTLKPGQMLPPEIKLARQFKVGRQSVREALRLLELSGFLTIKRGVRGGPTIEDTIIERIKELFLDSFRMNKISIRDVISVRLKLEPIIFEEAMAELENSDLESLLKNVADARERFGQNKTATDENIDFHRFIAKATRNHLYVLIMEVIMAVIRDFHSKSGLRISASRASVNEHELILDAIIKKRRKEAIALFNEHLQDLGNRMFAHARNHRFANKSQG